MAESMAWWVAPLCVRALERLAERHLSVKRKRQVHAASSILRGPVGIPEGVEVGTIATYLTLGLSRTGSTPNCFVLVGGVDEGHWGPSSGLVSGALTSDPVFQDKFCQLGR